MITTVISVRVDPLLLAKAAKLYPNAYSFGELVRIALEALTESISQPSLEEADKILREGKFAKGSIQTLKKLALQKAREDKVELKDLLEQKRIVSEMLENADKG